MEEGRRSHTVNHPSEEEIPVVTLSDSDSDSMSVVSSSSSKQDFEEKTKPNLDESKIYALKSKMKKLKSKMKKLKLKSKMKKLKSKLKKLRADEPKSKATTSIPPQYQHLIRIKFKTKDSVITKSVASASSFPATATNIANKTKLTCPNCHKTFADRKGIRYHLTMRVCQIKKEKPSHVQCPKCFRTYTFPTGLMKHAQSGKCSGKPTLPSQTESKNKSQPTHPLLSTPLTSSSSSTSTCDICFKTFYDSRCFLRHMNTHTGEKQYQCDYCPYKSRLSYNIYKHLLTMHCEDYIPQFTCKICSKSFGDQPNLLAHLSTDHNHAADDDEKKEIHVKIHNGPGDHLFKCHETKCSYVSRNGLGELQRHLRVLHNKWYLCQVCCRAFFQRSQFDEHLAEAETQTQTQTEAKTENGAKSDGNVEADTESDELLVLTPKYCLICSQSFKSQCVLNQHVGDHFSQNVPFCHVCSQAFPTTTELTQHFTSAHAFEKERIYPFTCEKCHKSFKRRRKLKAHNQKRHPQENGESDESVN